MEDVFRSIENRQRAKQLISFEGLNFGNRWPTDIDATVDIHGDGFVLIEVKRPSTAMTTGQTLYMNNFAKRCTVPVLSMVVDNIEDDPEKDVPLKDCPVRMYSISTIKCPDGSPLWVILRGDSMTVKKMLTKFIKFVEDESGRHFIIRA